MFKFKCYFLNFLFFNFCRTVHIHGTNGAKFNTFGTQPSTRPYTASTPRKNFFQHPTYEEWYNPKYSNTRHRTIQTISDGTIQSSNQRPHQHHHHHHHDHKPKASGFYAVNLGGGKLFSHTNPILFRNLFPSSITLLYFQTNYMISQIADTEANKDDKHTHHHHPSRRRSTSYGAECRSRSSHSTNEGKTSKCSSGSNGSNGTRPSGKTCSSRSTKSSTKIDYNVKGSSAVILTPDTIVYNDTGLWGHKYDHTSRAMSGISANSTSQK